MAREPVPVLEVVVEQKIRIRNGDRIEVLVRVRRDLLGRKSRVVDRHAEDVAVEIVEERVGRRPVLGAVTDADLAGQSNGGGDTAFENAVDVQIRLLAGCAGNKDQMGVLAGGGGNLEIIVRHAEDGGAVASWCCSTART